MKNAFCWIQLQSTDFEQAKKFYTSLFDWKLTETPEKDHPYTHIDTGEGPGGGIMPAGEDCPSNWMPYVQVEDIERHTKKAEQLGAKVIMGVTNIDASGRFSVIQDPTGAFIGMYQA